MTEVGGVVGGGGGIGDRGYKLFQLQVVFARRRRVRQMMSYPTYKDIVSRYDINLVVRGRISYRGMTSTL
jgi:hypothetical protein